MSPEVKGCVFAQSDRWDVSILNLSMPKCSLLIPGVFCRALHLNNNNNLKNSLSIAVCSRGCVTPGPVRKVGPNKLDIKASNFASLISICEVGIDSMWKVTRCNDNYGNLCRRNYILPSMPMLHFSRQLQCLIWKYIHSHYRKDSFRLIWI